MRQEHAIAKKVALLDSQFNGLQHQDMRRFTLRLEYLALVPRSPATVGAKVPFSTRWESLYECLRRA